MVSSPAATRPRNAEPSAPPSGTATQSTGSPVPSASAWTHSSTRVPPPVATMRRAGRPLASIARRVTNPDASNVARRIAAGPWVRSRSASTARRCRIVDRRALATRVRRPHGDRAGIARRSRVSGAETVERPVHEQAAGVARPADEEVAGRGVRDRVVAAGVLGDLVLGDDDPDDERRTEDHEHVTGRVGAGDDLLRERVDAPRREHRPVGDRRPVRTPPRSGRAAGAGRSVMPASLATAGSHGRQSNSGNAVAAVDVSSTASPPSAWFATACAGQKPAASGYSRRGPAEEADELAALGRVARAAGAAAGVAVEQARRARDALLVDRRERRDHRRDRDATRLPAHVAELGRAPLPGPGATPRRRRARAGRGR